MLHALGVALGSRRKAESSVSRSHVNTSAGSRIYSDMTYGAVVQQLQRLAALRPDLARLTTTQAEYGLPSVGVCSNADGTRSACLVHVLEITNHSSAARDVERPQMLVSGALHGDERVGITTALELSRWLVERYDADPWARRLVNTRTVLVMPMANAIGVEQRRREELSYDPNRDFPYVQDPRACMLTVAGRSINEVFRSRLLQLVVTFHGGMQAIGYNWGSFNHYAKVPRRSPDDNSQRHIAASLSRFAGTGGVRGNVNYPFQTMNDLVYPVHGGMEDWGYAASWDRPSSKPCTPRSYGGYHPSRTTYNDAMARAYTVLVETSDAKAPPASTYGGEGGVYAPGQPDDGHVPRNMRLALAAIDLLQPHVRLWLDGAGEKDCVAVRWEVWGAVRVDSATPLWRRWPATHPAAEWMEVPGAAAQAGEGVWGPHSSALAPSAFSACLALPAGRVQVAVRVQVDSSWGSPPSGAYGPGGPPRSHLANARASADYHQENGGRHVRGKVQWLSEALDVGHGPRRHRRRST